MCKHTNKNSWNESLQVDIPTSFVKSMLDYLNIDVARMSLFLFVCFLHYHPYFIHNLLNCFLYNILVSYSSAGHSFYSTQVQYSAARVSCRDSTSTVSLLWCVPVNALKVSCPGEIGNGQLEMSLCKLLASVLVGLN